MMKEEIFRNQKTHKNMYYLFQNYRDLIHKMEDANLSADRVIFNLFHAIEVHYQETHKGKRNEYETQDN